MCRGLDQVGLAVGCPSLGEPDSVHLQCLGQYPVPSAERETNQFIHTRRVPGTALPPSISLPIEPLPKLARSEPRAGDPEGEARESSPVAARGGAEMHIEVLRPRGLFSASTLPLLLPPRKVGPRIHLRSQGQGPSKVARGIVPVNCHKEAPEGPA